MRKLLCALVALCAVPASAHATFGAPMSLPASGDEFPIAVASDGAGHGILAAQQGFPPYGSATEALLNLSTGKRQSFARTTVLDAVPREVGGADVLVRVGADRSRNGRLILRRLLPSGVAFDVWTSPRTAAMVGALARGDNETVVAWPQGRDLMLMTRFDGDIPHRPRRARLGLAGVASLDLVSAGLSDLVAAVASPGRGLVLASLSLEGRIRHEQVFAKADGLVELAATPEGRVGALVEDTGIEGDTGECVSDGGGRHIRVAVRERGARRFGRLRTIDSPPVDCLSGRARLVALPDERLRAIYPYGPDVRTMPAPARRTFTARSTIAFGAQVRDVLVTPAGELLVALQRSDALSVLRWGQEEERITDGPAAAPLLTFDSGHHAVLAWRAGDRLQIATDDR